MNIAVFNQKFLAPASIVVSILGILFLCQPWIMFLHSWSVLVMLVGLIAFNVSVHIAPPIERLDEDDTGPVSLSHSVTRGVGHG
jgi:hypothetical protein